MTHSTEDPKRSPFIRFSREEWSRLRASAPLTLTEEDLSSLRGLNEKVSLEEVIEVYLPLTLRDTVFKDESSYFHRYAHLSEGEARRVAAGIWAGINGVNLRENIAPTRERANLILMKGEDHEVLGAISRPSRPPFGPTPIRRAPA